MELKQGTFVRVLSGPYKDTEGVIEDIQPECSAVRIGTREGNAFAMLDDVKVIPDIGGQPAIGVGMNRPRGQKHPILKK